MAEGLTSGDVSDASNIEGFEASKLHPGLQDEPPEKSEAGQDVSKGGVQADPPTTPVPMTGSEQSPNTTEQHRLPNIAQPAYANTLDIDPTLGNLIKAMFPGIGEEPSTAASKSPGISPTELLVLASPTAVID